jgi:hypothetical protein
MRSPRCARKAPNPHRKEAGANRGRPKLKTKGTKKDARLLLEAFEFGGPVSQKMKLALKKLRERNCERNVKQLEATRKWLVKKIPTLKLVGRVLDDLAGGNEAYDKLLTQILEQMDASYDEGYSDAPGGAPSHSGGPDRAYMGEPSQHYVLVPASGGWSGYADR